MHDRVSVSEQLYGSCSHCQRLDLSAATVYGDVGVGPYSTLQRDQSSAAHTDVGVMETCSCSTSVENSCSDPIPAFAVPSPARC